MNPIVTGNWKLVVCKREVHLNASFTQENEIVKKFLACLSMGNRVYMFSTHPVFHYKTPENGQKE
jgi:hypothetical protein